MPIALLHLQARNRLNGGGTMSSFVIYLVGFVVLIIGLAMAASLLGVSSTWIGVGVIVLVGVGILTGVSRTRRPDPPET